ncbi:hypothetical protein PACTADRAFT_33105 [Pachysolen tannophilus NRRL Y-2460]|uniref:Uncharacterized protein n=1 Tax=Pachysolen tannophilus NRRL Y-2460 TaxID=669874 RepID=A0A1E4TVT9_PACTA|nr:hypothetical protein PACTADRAFT_33105 [Pachysolen tannophilus NRRL Y-2460]
MLSNFHSGSKTASSSVFSRNFQTSARLSGGAAAYSSNANNSRRNSWTPGSFQNDEVEVSADLQELIKKFTSIKDPTYQLVKIFGPAINFTEPSAVGSVSAKDKFKIHDHRKSWFGGSFPTDTDEPVGNESAVKDNSAEKIEKKKSLEDILKKFVIEKIKPNLTLFSDEIFFSPDATNYSYFVGCNKELIKTLPIEAHFFTKAGLIWNHLDNETKQKFYIAAKAHEDQLFCDQLHRRRIKSLQEETSVPEHQNDDFFVNSELEHSNKVVENKPSDDIVTTPKKNYLLKKIQTM